MRITVQPVRSNALRAVGMSASRGRGGALSGAGMKLGSRAADALERRALFVQSCGNECIPREPPGSEVVGSADALAPLGPLGIHVLGFSNV